VRSTCAITCSDTLDKSSIVKLESRQFTYRLHSRQVLFIADLGLASPSVYVRSGAVELLQRISSHLLTVGIVAYGGTIAASLIPMLQNEKQSGKGDGVLLRDAVAVDLARLQDPRQESFEPQSTSGCWVTDIKQHGLGGTIDKRTKFDADGQAHDDSITTLTPCDSSPLANLFCIYARAETYESKMTEEIAASAKCVVFGICDRLKSHRETSEFQALAFMIPLKKREEVPELLRVFLQQGIQDLSLKNTCKLLERLLDGKSSHVSSVH